MEKPRKPLGKDTLWDTSEGAKNAGHTGAHEHFDNPEMANLGGTYQGIAKDAPKTPGMAQPKQGSHDAIDAENPQEIHKGSTLLIDSYNINDQAHSDSSIEDFIPTTSSFKHANQKDKNA